MSFTVVVPQEYGYVIGTGVVSAFVLAYLGGAVIKKREEAKVDLPALYADQADVDKDRKKLIFNCYQRGHQNALESYPQFLMLLFIGGLKHPLIASGAGVTWCLARILYAWGYWTGEPKNRRRGGFQHLAMIALLGTSVSMALSILKWTK